MYVVNSDFKCDCHYFTFLASESWREKRERLERERKELEEKERVARAKKLQQEFGQKAVPASLVSNVEVKGNDFYNLSISPNRHCRKTEPLEKILICCLLQCGIVK